MISQTAEYALRAIVCLVTYPKNNLTTPQIAKITKVPPSYLSKVMQSLRKARLVQSQRGLHGGFKLLKDPEKLTLLEVVDAVDPIQMIQKCPLGLQSHGMRLCSLHKSINDTIFMMREIFREATVQDILDRPGRSKPLCETLETKNI